MSPPADRGDGSAADITWYRRVPVQRRLRLVGRLAHMHPREIVHRVAKVAAKHAARWRGSEVETADPTRPLPPQLEHEPTAYLVARPLPRGFFACAERATLVAACRATAADDVARTLREADALLDGGITLLGHVFRPADPDFDWLADPTRGQLWPLTALDDNDVVRGVDADVKLVWEVNRHQFLVTLARASAYSGDPRYGRAAVAMLESWLAANPPGIGVNWSSNLEVAIRLTSWVWTLHYLVGTDVLGDDVLRTWLRSLRTHRDHVARHLSIYTDATNHLIGEAAALAIACLWLPELDDAAHWQAVTIEILAREIDRQVADDGIGREQATGYQRYVLDWMLQVIALAERNAIALPAVIPTRTAAMLDALAALVGPGGRAPRIGDSDHARAVPFFTADYWCFDEILALGAAVLGTRASGVTANAHESVIWTVGPSASSSAAPPTSAPTSRVFQEGGYAVLPARSFAPGARLVFDCGPLGYLPHASHGHADLLSVLVDVGDAEMLIDPGTFAYHDARGRRDLFRSTRSHNTVEVGGRDQADGFDPFMWLNIPASGLETARLGDAIEYVEAWHDGYRRLRVPVRHRRGVLAVPGAWLVIDWLEGRGTQRFTRWFHAAPTTRILTKGDATAHVATLDGRATLALSDVRGTGDDAPSAMTIATAPYSERYGDEVAAPVVSFTDEVALPALRVTAIVPETSAAPSAFAMDVITSDRASGMLRMRLRTSSATLDIVLRGTNAATTVGDVTTDARIAVRIDHTETPAVLVGGSVFLRKS